MVAPGSAVEHRQLKEDVVSAQGPLKRQSGRVRHRNVHDKQKSCRVMFLHPTSSSHSLYRLAFLKSRFILAAPVAMCVFQFSTAEPVVVSRY